MSETSAEWPLKHLQAEDTLQPNLRGFHGETQEVSFTSLRVVLMHVLVCRT